jgi:hypothetical protein
MSFYRTSLLAFASLLPIALAMPAQAAGGNFLELSKDNKTKVFRDIGGKQVDALRCQWYNWHQSISLWPVYVACDGKTANYVRDVYHPAKNKNKNGFSINAIKLMEAQADNHSGIFKVPNKHISFHIGGKDREALPCAWFNYIESRHRMPLYVDCGGKSHRLSYGMYSAPDFLKDFGVAPPKGGTEAQFAALRISAERAWEAKQTGPAPDIVKAINASGNVTKQIGATSITLSRCEWSNFFQSISFLPRYVTCKAATHKAQPADYENNKNLHKIEFKFGADASAQDGSEFVKFLELKVATRTVKATVCEWYNLVQSEARWPIYRNCPTNTSDTTYSVKNNKGPGPDLLVRHKLHYKN